MLDIIKTIIEKIFGYETNITDYEKMENKYKVGRKKFLLIVFFLLVLISFNSTVSVLWTHYYSNLLRNIALALIATILVGTFTFGKNQVVKLAMVLAYSIMPIFTLIMIIELYYEGFSVLNFILAIIMLLFTILMYSSAYLYIRDKLFIGEPVELTFVVSEEDEQIKAKLISISKNGDYIIQPIDNENAEILLNKDHVRKVIYDKTS